MKKKTVLIPFSGGVDSTYLAYKNLEEGNDIILAHYNIENNYEQMNVERLAIKDIVPELQNYFPGSSVKFPAWADEEKYITKQSVDLKGSNMVNGPQPLIWIFCTIFNENLWDVDEVQIGYVNGDDAIPYINDIKKLYRSYSPFMEERKGKKNELPPLKFPLIKEYKWVIWEKLPYELRKLTTFCEYSHDRYSPCGECKPCLIMMFCNLWERWHKMNEITPKVREKLEYPRAEDELGEDMA